MEIALTLTAIGLNLLLLLAGIKKVKFGTSLLIAMTIADLMLAALPVVLLGLWGIPVAVAIVTIIAFVLMVRSTAEFETVCASCSIYGQFDSKERAAAYIRDLFRTHESLKWLGLMGLGNLVLRLSERHRSPGEIRHMAAPIATLAAINGRDPLYLADKIDQILRRQGYPASETLRVADKLTAAAQASASTFDEMLDALSSL